MEWGPFVVQVAILTLTLAGGVVAAIVLLFRTMGSSYGKIIESLQEQNVSQQKQINLLAEGRTENFAFVTKLQKDHIDSERRCASDRLADQATLADLRHRLGLLGDRQEATDRSLDEIKSGNIPPKETTP